MPWIQFPADLRPRYNIAPTQPVLALANDAPNRFDFYHWGLIPSWVKDRAVGNRMINARARRWRSAPPFARPEQYQRWLEGPDPQSLPGPYPAELMEPSPVSRTVNNPRNETSECIAGLTEP